MDKLKMHSPNMTEENIARIREMFPGCVTEVEDETTKHTKGTKKYKLAVDFDLLRQELSESIVEGPQERYHLNWPGKREALLTANAPIARTLRPCPEESVDFDTTKNLFIEGDNLDALKLLQETYLGKVKMIYIDPPYNTGNDFIYEDDFAENTDEFLKRSNQKDEEGNRLVANTEANGRFHSDWLSMIYPRLKLARNLLSDEGVIFISNDDVETHNMRKICDETFGEDNFIANLIWEKRTNRENRKVVSYRHDNILCYCKSRGDERPLKQLPMNEKALSNYKNPDNDPRGLWKSDPATAQAGHGTKNQFYDLVAPNGKVHKLESGRCWLYTKPVMDEAIKDNRIWFGKDGNGVPRVKTYLEAKERGLTPETILFSRDVSTNEAAKNNLKILFDGVAVFETPKPVELIKLFLQLSSENGVVMDFFAGSSVTAHAAIQLNAEDGGNRKFIMVQIPEPCDYQSEAFKAGYKTIAEISKERIRRAGKKILDGECHEGWNKDVGFRVLKVDSSNMADVYYTPDAIAQGDLLTRVDNIKPDRTAVDMLFQVLLDWGVDLALPIRKEVITTEYTEPTESKKQDSSVSSVPSVVKKSFDVFFVDGNALVACFDKGVSEELVKELARHEPLRVVFRDNGFASDAVKINVEQIFRQMSPGTEVKAI
ncbi:MAG: site-specific DNA-methyltransferase [Mariprofundaceae bacterium]|nr:site-specific DNA-methyltransferase [Mariprofundaceae bacterium]